MGGSGETTQSNDPLNETDFNAILAYLDTLPTPDNPALKDDGTPVNAEAVARGKLLFEGKAACAACHSGGDKTDNLFHNVGTQVNFSMDGTPELFPHDVNTPPLHGLFRSGPYLHDGSLATLADRVDPTKNPGDMHGTTSTLSAEERSDLVEYLRTL
jgi:cytochrome c peroxidase